MFAERVNDGLFNEEAMILADEIDYRYPRKSLRTRDQKNLQVNELSKCAMSSCRTKKSPQDDFLFFIADSRVFLLLLLVRLLPARDNH